MRRRDFLGVVGTAAFAGDLKAQPRRVRRIAIIHLAETNDSVSEAGADSWRAFFTELRYRGYVEGQNLQIERYAIESGFWRSVPQGLSDLLAREPEVIVAESSPWVRGISAIRPDIALVALVTDPLAEDVASSLAKPGRNMTGVSADTGEALLAKHLELLLEAAPSRRTVACLGASWPNPGMRPLWRDAQKRGVRVQEYLVHTQFRQDGPAGRYADAFQTLLREGSDAVLVLADPEHFRHASVIGKLALEHRVPVISPFRSLTEAGGLLSYGPDWLELERRRAEYVARILDGARAGELPIQQPAKFELVLSMQTAREIKTDLGQSLLARADDVIE